MLEKVRNADGFIAALDQSGGSSKFGPSSPSDITQRMD